MKKYLAFDGINGGHEDFDTIEEARKWLEECFLDEEEGYHPDFASCKIYQLAETVECDVVDKKENYKYDYEEEGDESEVWPYDPAFDEIWEHRFVPVAARQSKMPTEAEMQEAANNYNRNAPIVDQSRMGFRAGVEWLRNQINK